MMTSVIKAHTPMDDHVLSNAIYSVLNIPVQHRKALYPEAVTALFAQTLLQQSQRMSFRVLLAKVEKEVQKNG